MAKPMLEHFGIRQLRLMIDNPRKTRALEEIGISIVERITLVLNRIAFNEGSLATKANKLDHLIPMPPMLP